MGDWNRSTSKMRLDEIQPEVWNAIQEHFGTYNIKPDMSNYLMCIRTISTKKKKRLFGGGLPNQTTQTVIITPIWLVIAVQGDKSDSPGVLSIQLKDANAKDYKDDPSYNLVPDAGIFVTGIYTGRVGMHGNAQISSLLVLGEESAAGEFKEKLFEAIARIKQ